MCQHGFDRAKEFCPVCDNRSKVLPLEEEITSLRQQVATITEQRDLAVVALRKIVRSAEMNQAAINAFLLIEANEALAAIQSAEVTK